MAYPSRSSSARIWAIRCRAARRRWCRIACWPRPTFKRLACFSGSVFVIVTGAAWFILRGLHQLFFKPVRAGRVWREAILIAVFVLSLAWLQLNQAFSLLLAAVIAVALILLEIFLNIRVRDE